MRLAPLASACSALLATTEALLAPDASRLASFTGKSFPSKVDAPDISPSRYFGFAHQRQARSTGEIHQYLIRREIHFDFGGSRHVDRHAATAPETSYFGVGSPRKINAIERRHRDLYLHPFAVFAPTVIFIADFQGTPADAVFEVVEISLPARNRHPEAASLLDIDFESAPHGEFGKVRYFQGTGGLRSFVLR